MNRTSVALVAVAVAAAVTASTCTGSRAPQPVAGATSAPPRASAPGPGPAGSPLVLDRLVLRADLWSRPGGWDAVMFIPFGGAEEELGFHHFRDSVDSMPSGFAVGPDGTFWIADRWKERLAHYSGGGRFLGEVSAKIQDSRIHDIVMRGDRIFVLSEGAQFVLADVTRQGVATIIRPILDGGRLAANFLYAADPPIVFDAAGYRDPVTNLVGPGPHGVFRTDELGATVQLPGLPAGPDRWFQARHLDTDDPVHQEFEFITMVGGSTRIRPFRIDVRAREGDRVRPIPSVMVLEELTPVGGKDLVAFVELSPSRPGEADRFGGGRWLLRLGDSPVLWERLPQPQIGDEPVWRHLVVGPDQGIYLMVVKRKGIQILRRPDG